MSFESVLGETLTAGATNIKNIIEKNCHVTLPTIGVRESSQGQNHREPMLNEEVHSRCTFEL